MTWLGDVVLFVSLPFHDCSHIWIVFLQVCWCLLKTLKYCTRNEYVEQNLHLVYALVYSQGEFNEAISSSNSSELILDLKFDTCYVNWFQILIMTSQERILSLIQLIRCSLWFYWNWTYFRDNETRSVTIVL